MQPNTRAFWVTLVFWLASCGGNAPPAPAPTAPTTLRAGIQPIYFGVVDDTVAATATQTRAVWSNGWGTDQFHVVVRKQLQQAQALGATYAVVDTSTALEDDGGQAVRLRTIFDELRAGGVLSNVRALFVCDECEQKGFTAAAMGAAAGATRAVAAEYAELAGVQLMVNYGCGNDFVGWQAMDIVGCDRYDRSAAETHANLRAKAPGKRYALFAPGVEPYYADPEPYVNEAQADPDVVVVVFFIAHDNADTGLGVGILHNRMAAAYCGASTTLLTQRKGTC